MKKGTRLFFIFLIPYLMLIMCNCSDGHKEPSVNEVWSQEKAPANSKTVLFTVVGISCDSCITAIKTKVEALGPGIHTCEAVKRPEKNTRVVYDPQKVSIEQIKAAITAAKKTVTATFED